jgi:hypothetical protein
MRISARTLLRVVRRMPIPEAVAVRVLGVDDWCKRRGQTYDSAHTLSKRVLEFTVFIARAPLRERYGSAWKRAALPRHADAASPIKEGGCT